jgi:sec-independent protein translocase protein TatA
MGGFSFWHILVVGVLFLLLFGRGRFSETMGDVAKGIKSFKKGMADDDEPAPPRIGAVPPTVIDAEKQNDKQP